MIVAALAVTGCKSDPAGESPPPGMLLQEPGSEEARAAAAQAALGAAQAAWQDGDALTAYALANRALRESPPPSYEEALRRLRSRARAAMMGRSVLRARVVPARDAVTNGDEVAAEVVFENRSGAALTVPHQEEGSSPAQMVLRIVREDHDIWGNLKETEFTLRVPLESDLLIAPGVHRAVPIRLPSAYTRFAHQGLSVLRIGGSFRPVVVRVGESEFFDAVPLAEAPVRVFLENYEQLAEDPLGSLEKSVAKRSPPHILTAVELLAPRDRETARTLLAEASEKDPPLSFVLDAAIKRIDTLSGGTRRNTP